MFFTGNAGASAVVERQVVYPVRPAYPTMSGSTTSLRIVGIQQRLRVFSIRLRSRIRPRAWPTIARNILIATASSAVGRSTDEQAVSKILLLNRVFEIFRPKSDHASAANASRRVKSCW